MARPPWAGLILQKSRAGHHPVHVTSGTPPNLKSSYSTPPTNDPTTLHLQSEPLEPQHPLPPTTAQLVPRHKDLEPH